MCEKAALVSLLGRDRVQMRWTGRVGSSRAAVGAWWAAAPRPGVLAECLRRLSREEEE